MDPMNTVYTARKVCERTCLTYKQLDDLARKGLVAPSVSPAEGKGTRRLYSERDLILLNALSQLRELGVGRRPFRAIVNALQSRKSKLGKQGTYLSISGGKIEIVDVAESPQIPARISRLTLWVPLFDDAWEERTAK